MVDFRYHLVSLISVFFALAIGIILGAGPLQNSIGNVLQGQVADLRVTNENLKQENADLAQAIDSQDQAFNEIAPSLVEGTLTGRTVAIVVLPGVVEADVSAARAKLELAGAKVTGQASVTEAWTAASTTSFRSTFSDQIRSYVPGVADDADTNLVLAQALNALVREGAAKHDTLAGLMTGTDTPMLAIDGLGEAADAVLVFAPDVDMPADADADAVAQQQYTTQTLSALVTELGTRGPAAVAGAANSDTDVVKVLREAGAPVSTIDSPDTVVGQINAAIAVANELRDQLVHLGLDAGAQAIMGARTEAPAQAAPAEPAEPAEEPAADPSEDSQPAEEPADAGESDEADNA
ncbi:copper transporter [Trueperella bernardiae]|uniref:Copper transporter n=1 Tax=Trueperella bernardiae TaxID=59561 RepID=A0AAW6ZNA9_9ACTO|nr:copper transporter [Trueperella bernardiae]MDK8602703.1 copper transporter [Trueperella bernardiae]